MPITSLSSYSRLFMGLLMALSLRCGMNLLSALSIRSMAVLLTAAMLALNAGFAAAAGTVERAPYAVIEPPAIRIAALKFGTLNWELETIRRQKFDHASGFQLQVIPLAGISATRTALLSRSSDVIVADWLWVNRQRAQGQGLQFVPFSTSIGKLMLARNSGIDSLADLKGKRIGIAGGPASKGWLLLRARALQQGIDLAADSEQQYGAPPLLNAALEQRRIDAVITFWHYAARLEAKGYRALTDLKAISTELGLDSDLPMLGFVFHQDWAQRHPQLVSGLLRASTEAKAYLRQTADGWKPLRGLMKAPDQTTFEHLKQGYLAGTPAPFDPVQLDDAQRLYGLLYQLGGERLVGPSADLDRGSFWLPSGH